MIRVIRKAQQTTTQWAGGTTTQLGIFPQTGDYATRDFSWRISTAEIVVPESPFTQLPGVTRHLMVLDGNLTLAIEGSEAVELKPFDRVRFDGGQAVVGKGVVTDFNLMLKGQWDGILQHERISEETTIASIGEYLCIFVVNGLQTLMGETLEAGDFAIIHDEETVHMEGNGDIVIAYLWFDETPSE